MKKLLLALLVLTVGVNAYYSRKLYKFALHSQEYFKWNTLKVDCLEQKSGWDKNDIWRLSKGAKLDHRPGGYDTQIPECKAYYAYMCWSIDTKDPKAVEHCKDRLFNTTEEYEEYKKSGKIPE